MKLSIITAVLFIAGSIVAEASEMTLRDLEPVRGDKAIFNVSEITWMSFEETPVRTMVTGTGTQTSEVVAVSKGGGRTVYLLLTKEAVTTKNTRGEGEPVTSTRYSLQSCRATPHGLYTDSHIGWEDGEDNSVDVGRTVLDIRLPCAPGTNWNVGRLVYSDGLTLVPESKAISFETIQVPGGTYENCLKIVSTCPNGLGGSISQGDGRLDVLSGEVTVTTWYYPRVGIVKEFAKTSVRLRPEGADGAAVLRIDSETTTELAQYKFAGK